MIGKTHLQNVLTALDIPPVHHKTVKKAERRIGIVLESRAKDSCRKCLSEEFELVNQAASSASTPPVLSSPLIHTSAETFLAVPHKEQAVDQQPLSPSTLARYEQRVAEGYDLPDAKFAMWKKTQFVSHQ